MHKICELLDRNRPKKACDSSCKNYLFDHLDCACVLSSVFSVNKGVLCAEHTGLSAHTKAGKKAGKLPLLDAIPR